MGQHLSTGRKETNWRTGTSPRAGPAGRVFAVDSIWLKASGKTSYFHYPPLCPVHDTLILATIPTLELGGKDRFCSARPTTRLVIHNFGPGAPRDWCPTRLVPHETGAPQDWCPTRLVPHKTGAPQDWCPTRLVPHKTGAPQDWCPTRLVLGSAGAWDRSVTLLLMTRVAAPGSHPWDGYPCSSNGLPGDLDPRGSPAQENNRGHRRSDHWHRIHEVQEVVRFHRTGEATISPHRTRRRRHHRWHRKHPGSSPVHC